MTGDSAGVVFLSDTNHHRIRAIDANGTISAFAGTGAQGSGGDGGPAVNAMLNRPERVALGPDAAYMWLIPAPSAFGAYRRPE